MAGTEWSLIDPNPDVLFSDMGEGSILFDLNTKQYYSLNDGATAAWSYLESGGSLAQLETALAGVATPENETDPYGLREFAAFLLEQKLATPASVPATAEVAAPTTWVRPRIEPHGNPLSDVILSPFDPTVPIPE